MCFVLIALQQQADYPFILASNRDEFFARPALRLHQWQDKPYIGGRDLGAGGTWLAINKDTKDIAVVTNYRSGKIQLGKRSRGLLVQDMLEPRVNLTTRLRQLVTTNQDYAGFNIIVGNMAKALYYYSNCQKHGPNVIKSGIHALSNAFLDTPWPKVLHGKTCLQQLLAKPLTQTQLIEQLLVLLADTTPASDNRLPDTGIGLERERWLSPLFIRGETYGTRCSTIVLMHKDATVTCYERTYTPEGKQDGTDVTLSF